MMNSQHVDLSESTQIHKLVKAKKSIGIHWGTYDMGSHEVTKNGFKNYKFAIFSFILNPEIICQNSVKKLESSQEGLLQ